MIASRLRLGLLGALALALLSGCGWFEASPSPHHTPLAPGADRLVATTGQLPPDTANRLVDGGSAAASDTQDGSPIGSVVSPRKKSD
ncbi:MAG: hypothetical protein ACHQK9_14405 [Reyranellales bacterium]